MRALGPASLAAALLFSLQAHAQPFRHPGIPSGPPPQQVVVSNFPNPQNVVGSVSVTNLPAVQDVNVVNAPPQCGATPRFQLVGFTTAMFTGGEGVLGFTSACQQQFANSRMCTSLEVMDTPAVPSSLAGEAWVRPSFVAINFDASGVTSSTCQGWSNDAVNDIGLAVDAAGRFTYIGYCATPRAVACCAPVP
jgi:hypothetical protein